MPAPAALSARKTRALWIEDDSSIVLNAVPVSLAELEQRLTAQKAQTPNFRS